MERPGVVFEVMNEDGMSLFTPCVPSLAVPFGWTSGPVRFRTVEAPRPRRSTPIPSPGAPPARER